MYTPQSVLKEEWRRLLCFCQEPCKVFQFICAQLSRFIDHVTWFLIYTKLKCGLKGFLPRLLIKGNTDMQAQGNSEKVVELTLLVHLVRALFNHVEVKLG